MSRVVSISKSLRQASCPRSDLFSKPLSAVYSQSGRCCARVKVANGSQIRQQSTSQATQSSETQYGMNWIPIQEPRLPRSVQAAFLRPLRRKAEHGIPVCNLQLRSYSVRNLELMADVALRAAYYLGISASGPVPLPRLVERWTVSKSNFAHKKTQENFERITMRRMIQIQDADLDVVQIWLAFLRKHAYHGVGMKANVWEHESLDTVKSMDDKADTASNSMEDLWNRFGARTETPTTVPLSS